MSETPGVAVGTLGRHGETIVAQRVEPGNGVRYVSHNYCDPCSWWQESQREQGGSTTTSDELTYTIDGMANGWVIDARHKRFTYEDEITAQMTAPNGNTLDDLVPKVYVNGSPLDQDLEDDDADSDRYTIVYSSTGGTPAVVFSVARQPSDVVTVDFRKADKSTYTFMPAAGKRLVFEDAEVDHTADLDMDASFRTMVYGSHSAAPPAGTGGTLQPLGGKRYNNVRDFHGAAKEFMGPLPAGLGGTGGVPVEAWTWKWGYSRADEVYSSLNYLDQNGYPTEPTWNRVCAFVEGDKPYAGHYMTITYYGQQEDQAT